MADPAAIPDADYLFIESTYGNYTFSHRTLEESKLEFLEAIQYAVSTGKK